MINMESLKEQLDNLVDMSITDKGEKMTNEYGMELNEYGGITEYSVEIRDLDDGHFIKQIDVLDNYEEAEELIEKYDNYDSDTEILEIHCIDYDEDGEERAYYLCE